MRTPAISRLLALRSAPGRLLRWTVRGVLAVVMLLAIGWGCLALTIDGPGRTVAAVYAVVSLLLLLLVRGLKGWFACGGLFALLLGWWLSLAPRSDRAWLSDVSRVPSTRVIDQQLTVANLRDFVYRSKDDFTPRWVERRFDLARVVGVDLFLSDWGDPFVVHTILSWEFAGGEHLAISIETRKEEGEQYSALRGFFRQYELYYVVGDERDLIGSRAGVRGEKLSLYRLALPPEEARALLRSYARRINRLAERPAWYNALNHNCTTTIRMHMVELGIERPWNWRVLVNGHVAKLLYMREVVDTSLSFEELQERSDVTEAARAAAGAADFSERIRRGLPPRPTGT
jgi:hypothetical protein